MTLQACALALLAALACVPASHTLPHAGTDAHDGPATVVGIAVSRPLLDLTPARHAARVRRAPMPCLAPKRGARTQGSQATAVCTTTTTTAATTAKPTTTAAPGMYAGTCTVDTAGCLSSREVHHWTALIAKREAGFTCPMGSTYTPNSNAMMFDCRLWRASYKHSKDMADNNYFSHSSQDGRSPWDRARDEGFSANGENIAAGSSRPGSPGVLQQWHDSDGHCRNMGNAGFAMGAIGHAYVASSQYRHYWTQMFRSGLDSSPDHSCIPTCMNEGLACGTVTW